MTTTATTTTDFRVYLLRGIVLATSFALFSTTPNITTTAIESDPTLLLTTRLVEALRATWNYSDFFKRYAIIMIPAAGVACLSLAALIYQTLLPRSWKDYLKSLRFRRIRGRISLAISMIALFDWSMMRNHNRDTLSPVALSYAEDSTLAGLCFISLATGLENAFETSVFPPGKLTNLVPSVLVFLVLSDPSPLSRFFSLASRNLAASLPLVLTPINRQTALDFWPQTLIAWMLSTNWGEILDRGDLALGLAAAAFFLDGVRVIRGVGMLYLRVWVPFAAWLFNSTKKVANYTWNGLCVPIWNHVCLPTINGAKWLGTKLKLPLLSMAFKARDLWKRSAAVFRSLLMQAREFLVKEILETSIPALACVIVAWSIFISSSSSSSSSSVMETMRWWSMYALLASSLMLMRRLGFWKGLMTVVRTPIELTEAEPAREMMLAKHIQGRRRTFRVTYTTRGYPIVDILHHLEKGGKLNVEPANIFPRRYFGISTEVSYSKTATIASCLSLVLSWALALRTSMGGLVPREGASPVARFWETAFALIFARLYTCLIAKHIAYPLLSLPRDASDDEMVPNSYYEAISINPQIDVALAGLSLHVTFLSIARYFGILPWDPTLPSTDRYALNSPFPPLLDTCLLLALMLVTELDVTLVANITRAMFVPGPNLLRLFAPVPALYILHFTHIKFEYPTSPEAYISTGFIDGCLRVATVIVMNVAPFLLSLFFTQTVFEHAFRPPEGDDQPMSSREMRRRRERPYANLTLTLLLLVTGSSLIAEFSAFVLDLSCVLRAPVPPSLSSDIVRIVDTILKIISLDAHLIKAKQVSMLTPEQRVKIKQFVIRAAPILALPIGVLLSFSPLLLLQYYADTGSELEEGETRNRSRKNIAYEIVRSLFACVIGLGFICASLIAIVRTYPRVKEGLNVLAAITYSNLHAVTAVVWSSIALVIARTVSFASVSSALIPLGLSCAFAFRALDSLGNHLRMRVLSKPYRAMRNGGKVLERLTFPLASLRLPYYFLSSAVSGLARISGGTEEINHVQFVNVILNLLAFISTLAFSITASGVATRKEGWRQAGFRLFGALDFGVTLFFRTLFAYVFEGFNSLLRIGLPIWRYTLAGMKGIWNRPSGGLAASAASVGLCYFIFRSQLDTLILRAISASFSLAFRASSAILLASSSSTISEDVGGLMASIQNSPLLPLAIWRISAWLGQKESERGPGRGRNNNNNNDEAIPADFELLNRFFNQEAYAVMVTVGARPVLLTMVCTLWWEGGAGTLVLAFITGAVWGGMREAYRRLERVRREELEAEFRRHLAARGGSNDSKLGGSNIEEETMRRIRALVEALPDTDGVTPYEADTCIICMEEFSNHDHSTAHADVTPAASTAEATQNEKKKETTKDDLTSSSGTATKRSTRKRTLFASLFSRRRRDGRSASSASNDARSNADNDGEESDADNSGPREQRKEEDEAFALSRVLLICGHSFHARCITEWVWAHAGTRSRCPVCRKPLATSLAERVLNEFLT